MTDKDLIIINNEKIFKENSNFYCDNLDLKILPEGLNNYYKVQYIVRNSNKKGDQQINLKNVKVASSLFKFIYFIFKTIKIPKANYLIISITPYTFLAFLILFMFRKKRVFLYLFSKGHEEYRYILGNYFVWIYHIMYLIVTSNSKVLVNHERLFDEKKSYLINSSRLNELWQKNYMEPSLDRVKFLYIGRMNPEKGIFQFIEMLKKIKFNFEFSIVGDNKNKKKSEKNIKYLGYVANEELLIKIYDNHNIMVLPSFTEASPYVVDESLVRKRPVIIFDDIDYIVRGKIGVFVTKRNVESFSKTVKYIMDNYLEIQKKMEKNDLPTKEGMIKQISEIINL